MGNKISIDTELKDGVSKKLNGISSAFDKAFGKGSGASFFGNVGAKGVAAGFGVLDSAISGTIGFLGDAVSAAMDEEVSIAKLDAALKANVKGWDGNTAAIEGVLAKRMELGFSDDQQRSSLALLVAATNDESLALDMQRTAMDLARLKGIDLDTATKALIKTEDGGTRILKELGITVGENATQQEILTAVQAAAQGQAATYADTTSGKLTVAQVKFGEAMEKLGNEIMPAVSALITTAVDEWLPAFGRGWDTVSSAIKGVFDWIADLIARIDRGIAKVKEFLGAIGDINKGKNVGHDPISDFFSGKAAGGWVGLNGPELVLTGEKGPEYITPNHKLGGGGGGGQGDVYLDGERVGRILSGRLARDFRRSSLTTSRV